MEDCIHRFQYRHKTHQSLATGESLGGATVLAMVLVLVLVLLLLLIIFILFYLIFVFEETLQRNVRLHFSPVWPYSGHRYAIHKVLPQTTKFVVAGSDYRILVYMFS